MHFEMRAICIRRNLLSIRDFKRSKTLRGFVIGSAMVCFICFNNKQDWIYNIYSVITLNSQVKDSF
jgi:hypothetical protein